MSGSCSYCRRNRERADKARARSDGFTGAALRDMREATGRTRNDVAAAVGIHVNSVKYWEQAEYVDLTGHSPKLILEELGAKVFLTSSRVRGRASRGVSFEPEEASHQTDNSPQHIAGVRHGVKGEAPRLPQGLEKPVRTCPAKPHLACHDCEAGSCLRLAELGLNAAHQPLPKSDRPTCGAKTRAGHPCRAKVVPGKRRCRNHGGLSTGAKTEEGRALIAEAQRRRWRRVKAEAGE